jgi:hypothetical protein
MARARIASESTFASNSGLRPGNHGSVVETEPILFYQIIVFVVWNFLICLVFYMHMRKVKAFYDMKSFKVNISGVSFFIEDVIIFYVSFSDSERVKVMNDYILANRNLSTVAFRYFFVDGPRDDRTIPNLIIPQEIWDMRNISRNPPKDRDLLLKYFFCNKYFVERTRARWKLRIADDTLVNFRKLGKFISLMENRHNPLTEFIFKGHCLAWGEYVYSQGGSGNLMSRFACKVAIAEAVALLNYSDLTDDLSVGHYMTVFRRFPGQAIGGGPFSGHKVMRKRYLLRHKRNNFSSVPLCKNHLRFDWGCGVYVFPSNDLISLHLFPFAGMENLFTYGRVYFNAPDDIFLWSSPFYMKLCRETDRRLLEHGAPSLFLNARVKWGNNSFY